MDPDGKHVLVSCSTEVSNFGWVRRLLANTFRVQELQLWNIEGNELKLVRKYTGHVNREAQLRSCFGGSRERASLVVSPSEGERCVQS